MSQPDWFDENEERDFKRREWNKMQDQIDNPTRSQRMLAQVGATLITVGIIVVIVAFLLTMAWEMIKGG
jgi:hypothetical protein